MPDDLFDDDPDAAKKARDAALKRVTANGGKWQERMLAGLVLLRGFKGTAEDIRVRLRMKGLAKPHHYNAWGPAIKEAWKRKLITPTGERRPMRLDQSHGRDTRVYMVN